MIPYVGSPQRGEPTYETPYTKSQTPLNGPNNTRSIMANSPITDVIFRLLRRAAGLEHPRMPGRPIPR